MIQPTTYTHPQVMIDILLGRAHACEDMAQRLAKGGTDRDSLLEARQRYVSEAMQVEQAAFGTYRMPNEVRALVAGATPALAIDVPELTKWLCKNCGQATKLHEFTDYCMRCVGEGEPESTPPPAPTHKIPTAKEIIIQTLETYSLTIITQVEAELRRRGFTIGEFSYATSTRKRHMAVSRLGAAWQIATSGEWEFPKYTGQPFLVASQEVEGQWYQVYCCTVEGHRGNQCDCVESSYKADRLGAWCKHSIAAYMVYLACMALKADQPGKRVAA